MDTVVKALMFSREEENRWATPSKNRRLLARLGIPLFFLMAAYFAGLSKGYNEREAQRIAYERRLEGIQKEAQTARTELLAAQHLNRLAMAQSWLYRSAVALDHRNFGLANDFVLKAADSLSSVQAVEMGAKSADFAALRFAIEKTNINVALDIERQRKHLLELATQMEGLVSP